MRLGFYRALKTVKTLFKKSSEYKGKQTIKALETAARRIKSDTEKSVVFNLKDYRENLKFRFLFKLIDATSEGFAQAVLDRFQAQVVAEDAGSDSQDDQRQSAAQQAVDVLL